MENDLVLALSRAVDAARDDQQGPAVWVPLEATLPIEECAGFMYMGATEARIYDPLGPRDADCNPIIEQRQLIFLYKHGITRRYLNVGDDLNTYVYKPSMCQVGDPVYQAVKIDRAIHEAFEGIEGFFRASRTTPYGPEYIAERNARLIAAGYRVVG